MTNRLVANSRTWHSQSNIGLAVGLSGYLSV
jgi:hypothetical protein